MLLNWGRNAKKANTTTRVRRGRARPLCRPGLEILEDRTLLSIVIAPTNNNGNGYAGLSFSQSNGGNGGYVPPDTVGAAGPSSYVETVNQAIAIYSPKFTGATATTTLLSNFWFTVGGLTHADSNSTLADPMVVYDDNLPGLTPGTGRFIIGDLDVDTSSHVSRFEIAVSKSANPATLTTSDWNFYQINTTESGLDADYPGNFGYNKDAFVFTLNMFSSTGIAHVLVTSVNATDLANGVSQAQLHVFLSNVAGASIRPTVMHDAAAGAPMWLVTEHGDDQSIDVIKMTNVLSNAPGFTTTNLAVDPYTDIALVPPQQVGTTTTVTTNIDSRIQKAAEANGLLVAVQAVAVDSSEDDAQWYQINVSSGTPTLSQQGRVSASFETYIYYPSIDINEAGAIGMTYLESKTIEPSANPYMSMYVTGRAPHDPSGTMELPLIVPAGIGQGTYTDFSGGRAGDLSGINVDPTNGSFWAANEYATSASTNNWGTAIANFMVNSPPSLPAINPITLPFNQFPHTVAPGASSPDGLPLTYSVSTTGDNILYDLEQQYQFTGIGIQTAGVTAYVLHSSQSGQGVNGYYLIRPSDGALYAYDGGSSYTTSFNNSSLFIATLGAKVFTDPAMLLNAQAPINYSLLASLMQQYQFTAGGYETAGVTAYVVHSNQPGPGVNGYYLIRSSDGALYAYDGGSNYSTSFNNPNLFIATLGANVYATPAFLLNALPTLAVETQLYQLNQQYDLQAPNGSPPTTQDANAAQWLYSPVPNQYGKHWYSLTLSSDHTQSVLRAWEGYADSEVGAVVATIPDARVYSNPGWLSGATAVPNAPAGTATVDGSGNLTVGLPSAGFTGIYKVTVTVSDALGSTSQTVKVTSTDVAPTMTVKQGSTTIAPGSTVSYPHLSFPQSFTVSTGDANGATVSVSASAASYSQLFAVQQRYRLTTVGYQTTPDHVTAYVFSVADYNINGNKYYLLKSDGGLYAYDGGPNYGTTFANSANLITSFNPIVYSDPTLLTNAQPPVDYATLYNLMHTYQFTAIGYQTAGVTAYVFHSNQSGRGVNGYYLLAANGGLYAYDGGSNYTTSFTNSNLLGSLDPYVYVNPTLLTGALATPGLYLQLQAVEQAYDLTGAAYQIAGVPAYVLTAPINNSYGNQYYLLSTAGNLYKYDGSGSYAHTFANSANLIATLDPSVYANPALLTGAKAPQAATGVSASAANGTLTVSVPAAFVGTFQVTVTASDGSLTTTQTFQVMSTDTAPVLNFIGPQTASRSGSPLQVTLGATDAQSDPVTYSATAVGYSLAYNLEQQYHFTGVGYQTTPDGVTAYVLSISGTNINGNKYYLLKSDGGLYAYDGGPNYGTTFANQNNLVASLSASVYNTPTLLTSAAAPTAPGATVSVSGNTLTVNVAGLPIGLVFEVLVTVSDGAETSTSGFLVTVTA